MEEEKGSSSNGDPSAVSLINGKTRLGGNGATLSNDNGNSEINETSCMFSSSDKPQKIYIHAKSHYNEKVRPVSTECVDEFSCGLGSFRPSWLQKFANKNMFLFVYSITCLLQGMYYTYFASILTTIEKLYHIQSKTTGIIMSATEIGQISSSLLLTYYGSRGHRPKLIGYGVLIFVLACFLSTIPYFIYDQEMLENSLRNPARSSSSELLVKNMSLSELSTLNVCVDKSHALWTNSSVGSRSNVCNDEDANDRDEDRQKTHIVLTLLFISLLMIGTGYTAVQTLGIPYIDDNVAPRESPLYFGMTMGVKIFGPVLGFMLGSLCTSIYVHPFDDPGIDSTDRSWVGAWWLGILLIAVSLLTVAFPMMSFPRKLKSSVGRNSKERANKDQSGSNPVNGSAIAAAQKSSFSDSKGPVKQGGDNTKLRKFPEVMRRLLKNKILIWRTASSVLHILPIAGLYTFMPKYLESQFRLTAAKASMTAGLAGMLVMGFGILMSSLYMRKYKPTPKFVAAWIAMSALAYSIGMLFLSFVGCDSSSNISMDFKPANQSTSGGMYEICNRTCFCNPSIFNPVCSNNGVTYASPCLAGCSSVYSNASKKIEFSDCSCVNDDFIVNKGMCDLECNNIVWYILIFSVFVFIHSTSEVGMMLLTLRCVDPEDKTMALGLITFSIGLFGNVPCPIIYGAVVDSTCQLWENKCGEPGACQMYESHMFRKLFHGTTAGLMFLAFIVDVIVWLKAGSINFPENDIAENQDPTNRPNFAQEENSKIESTV